MDLCQLEPEMDPELEQAVVHYILFDTAEMRNKLFRTRSTGWKVFLLERREHVSFDSHLFCCERIIAVQVVLVGRCFTINFEHVTVLCIVSVFRALK